MPSQLAPPREAMPPRPRPCSRGRRRRCPRSRQRPPTPATTTTITSTIARVVGIDGDGADGDRRHDRLSQPPALAVATRPRLRRWRGHERPRGRVHRCRRNSHRPERLCLHVVGIDSDGADGDRRHDRISQPPERAAATRPRRADGGHERPRGRVHRYGRNSHRPERLCLHAHVHVRVDVAVAVHDHVNAHQRPRLRLRSRQRLLVSLVSTATAPTATAGTTASRNRPRSPWLRDRGFADGAGMSAHVGACIDAVATRTAPRGHASTPTPMFAWTSPSLSTITPTPTNARDDDYDHVNDWSCRWYRQRRRQRRPQARPELATARARRGYATAASPMARA